MVLLSIVGGERLSFLKLPGSGRPLLVLELELPHLWKKLNAPLPKLDDDEDDDDIKQNLILMPLQEWHRK